MVLHPQDLWALLTVWRSSLTLGTSPTVASQESYSLNRSSPWVNCFEKELSVSSSGFNVKETKISLESLLVAKSFTEKTFLYFPNVSNISIPWRMLMLVSFSLLEISFLPSLSTELFISLALIPILSNMKPTLGQFLNYKFSQHWHFLGNMRPRHNKLAH